VVVIVTNVYGPSTGTRDSNDFFEEFLTANEIEEINSHLPGDLSKLSVIYNEEESTGEQYNLTLTQGERTNGQDGHIKS